MKNKYVYVVNILTCIEKIIREYKETLLSKINIEHKEFIYSDLMPKDEVDRVKTYHEALDWAINDNSRIRNIALSGPYGSGKSTIINSYLKKSNIKDEKVLRISLATFDENNVLDIDRQQIIEKNILEQMIYRVDGKKTPFSRFKKINKVSQKTVWQSLIVEIIFFTSGWSLYNKNTILNLQNFNIKNIIQSFKSKWLTFIICMFFGATLIIILYYITRLILRGFKSAKIKVAATEIEISADNKEINKESIYNKYLDELLYFFEETKYDLVIFEDIDRFKNSAIFTNLRGINTFLTNYEKISRRIIFLYAIKDDVFLKRERTKFFDFIIPVIPFVDAFNSRQIVLNKFDYIQNSNIKKPSESLIKDITIFLDDMRMLTNIINEYIIYYKQINNKDINANNLFSIIVYKNLLPDDFSKLQYGDGLVKQVFDKKRKIVEQEIEKLEKKIKSIRGLIDLSNSLVINSIEDLLFIFERHWKKRGINHLYTNRNIEVNISNILSMKNDFDEKNDINVKMNNNYNFTTISYDEIFTAFGQYNNLFVSAEAIELKNKEKMQRKKEELNECLNSKNMISLISIKSLIKEYDVSEFFDGIKDEALLVFLIKEGYINETYRHYISYFYPGAVTQEDIDFLRSVKNNIELGYEYKLVNISEIIKDISADEFKSKSVLNNKLVEFLLNNLSNEQGRFNIILEELTRDINLGIDFIDQFCMKSEYKGKFIAEICKKHPSFWNYIMNKSKLTTQNTVAYFVWIIDSCDTNYILQMNEEESIRNFIQNTQNIFQIEYKSKVEAKLIRIFKELNIKFHLLDQPKGKKYIDSQQELEGKLIAYIFANNMFQINKSMLKYFYKYIMGSDEEKMKLFEKQNYTSIKMLENDGLNNYIESNLAEYLTEVFLKLPENTDEELSVIIEFLNNKEIDIDNIKIEIINKCDFIIEDLKSVPSNLWNAVIEYNKWDNNWLNIFYYFQCFNCLNNEIITQLSQSKTYEKLSIVMINKIDGIENVSKDILEKFYRYLYENLSDKSLSKIYVAIPECYVHSEDSQVSTQRMKLILDIDCVEHSSNNFLFLKNNYKELYYDWSTKNFDNLLENIIHIPLDIEDITRYLNENKISVKNKFKMINFNKELVINNLNSKEVVEGIFKLIRKGPIGEEDKSIFEAIIHLKNYNEDRKRLFASRVKYMKLDEISKYLNALGEPFSLLSEKMNEEGENFKIQKSDLNKYLLKQLVDCNYIKSFDESNESYYIKSGIEV
ncbi:NTPase [Clostridium estertheticum]|uniref:YobI family P-loop NTPase n=1 Tax=Clostridium estertheticum TaxID=238834 RepID=UPI001CF3DFF3|nr:NTPase [Clostridium estertheticum]MCB2353142.1 NTPase [Clostridium estertheticum]WAG41498.1 NTPase [Clostridium estertheticum]